jgi:hypothetical protein
MYSVSSDDGDSWTSPVPVSGGAGSHSQLPDLAVDESAIHVSWEDDRLDHFNVMYSRSMDGGTTWSTDEQINDTFYGARAHLLADEEGLHIVWCQYHGDDGWPSSWSSADYGILWYKFSDDSGIMWTDEFRVSQNEHIPPIDLPDRGANHVQLAELGVGFCAIWLDKRDGNIDLYLRNNRGDPAGVPEPSSRPAQFTSEALWATPLHAPLRELSLRVSSERSGRVSCQLIDPQGRVLARMAERVIASGVPQVVGWSLPPLGEGIHFARLSWGGGRETAVHRLVIVR